MVNQISDEGICPEEHRDEGSLFRSKKDFFPERLSGVDRTFRPCRKGFLPGRTLCSLFSFFHQRVFENSFATNKIRTLS
jgi:hypothetical protein